MLGRYKRAITIWKRLLEKGVDNIAHDECGEGISWAKSLINDCRYRIGNSYLKMGDTINAAEQFQMHIATRKKRVASIYPLLLVKKKLAEIDLA